MEKVEEGSSLILVGCLCELWNSCGLRDLEAGEDSLIF